MSDTRQERPLTPEAWAAEELPDATPKNIAKAARRVLNSWSDAGVCISAEYLAVRGWVVPDPAGLAAAVPVAEGAITVAVRTASVSQGWSRRWSLQVGTYALFYAGVEVEKGTVDGAGILEQRWRREHALAPMAHMANKTHRLHIPATSDLGGRLPSLEGAVTRHYLRAREYMGVADLDRPIHTFLYGDASHKAAATGLSGLAHAIPDFCSTHLIVNDHTSTLGAHEDVHILMHHHWGSSVSPLFREGWSVAADGQWQGHALPEYVRVLSAHQKPLRCHELNEDRAFHLHPDIAYPSAGAWIQFLLERHAHSLVVRATKASANHSIERLVEQAFGTSLQHLEDLFGEWVASRK